MGSDTLSVAEVSGLVQSYETLTYRHGLSFQEGERILRYKPNTYSELTIKQAVTSESTASKLYNWLRDGDSRSLGISLCDRDGAEAVAWKTDKAIATKIEGPSLQASSNEVAIDSITVMASSISVVAG